MINEVRPGDVLVCRGAGSWTAKLIEIGAVLAGQPSASHIAVVHHVDAAGTLWCVEGRPGGAGWKDAKAYLSARSTVTNAAQPKTKAQRDRVCAVIRALIGTPYDWDAIAQDAVAALGLPALWAEKWNGQVPAHVVCSSLAAYAYGQADLAAPGGADGPHVTPADWSRFVEDKGWNPGAR